MSKVKKQHYVPRFYLKHFASEKEEQVQVYDKINTKSFSSNVINIACEKYFYDNEIIDNTANVEQFLEKFFHPAENSASKYLNILIDQLDNNHFTEIDIKLKKVFSEFLALQLIRTREQKEIQGQLIDTIFQAINEKSETEYLLNTNEDKKRLFFLSSIMNPELIKTLTDNLINHMWFIYESKCSKKFITSDHPLVKRSHSQNRINVNGIGSTGIEIAWPLSPEYILVIMERTFHKGLEKNEGKRLSTIKPDDVEYYNQLQVIHSYRQLYSKVDNFESIGEFLNNNPIYKDQNRQRVSLGL